MRQPHTINYREIDIENRILVEGDGNKAATR